MEAGVVVVEGIKEVELENEGVVTAPPKVKVVGVMNVGSVNLLNT